MELSKEKMLKIAERKEKCIKCEKHSCFNCDNFVCANKTWSEEVAYYEKVRELLRADAEDRLVLLPCKVGDTVWYITSTAEICKAKVIGVWLNVYTKPQMWLEINYQSELIGEQEYRSRIDLMLGKTTFLTLEDAEAALEKMGGGEK